MKLSIFIFLISLISIQAIGQISKEKKVILFNSATMTLKKNIFTVEEITFKYIRKKKKTSFDSIKKSRSNLETINNEIVKRKKYIKSKKRDF